MTRISFALHLILPLTLGACTSDLDAERFDEGTSAHREDATIQLILRAANDLSLEVLDDDVGLDSRAAANIVSARPFDTLDALDAVAYVGPSALADLEAYAEEHWGGVWAHGVREGTPEAEQILLAANISSFRALDDDAGLDRRAAEGIVASRPFESLTDLDHVPYVGSSVFAKLSVHVAVLPGCIPTDDVSTFADLPCGLEVEHRLYTSAFPTTSHRTLRADGTTNVWSETWRFDDTPSNHHTLTLTVPNWARGLAYGNGMVHKGYLDHDDCWTGSYRLAIGGAALGRFTACPVDP